MKKEDYKQVLKVFKKVYGGNLTGRTKEQLHNDVMRNLDKFMLDFYYEKNKNNKKLKGGSLGSFFKKFGRKTKELFKKGIGKLKGVDFKRIFQDVSNTYRSVVCPNSRRLEYGELHYPCHNFSGPGTRTDLSNVVNYEPFNDIDACSKKHDLDYMKSKEISDPNERAKFIHQADLDAIECYDKFPNESGYKWSRLGILGKYNAEQLLSQMKGTPSVFYGGKCRYCKRKY